MTAMNLLIIMTDEHNSRFLGCAGHAVANTPNLDALAEGGTRFTSAYTTCPICVPARASFATGKHVHEIGNWDNAHPYDGRVPSWGHRLQENGNPAVSIGKLHYRNETDDTGFDEQINPMHVVDGIGDVLGSVRDPLPVRHKSRELSEKLGPGETSYTAYDRDIATAATAWLNEAAQSNSDTPWVLFVSFVCPHFPLVAPPQFYDLYDPESVAMPKQYRPEDRTDHPWIQAWKKCFTHDDYFDDEKRRIAVASYLGLCSFVDDNVGKVLGALEQSGLAATTRVVYVSDHGDNVGARGMWGKSNLYEESVSIPLIVYGPDVPAGKVCRTPVTLADAYATVLDAVGLPVQNERGGGRSWFQCAATEDDIDRTVLSQYHAVAATTGAFMLRRGRYKYCHYVGLPPQLFDLEDDPEELIDLAMNDSHNTIVREFESELSRLLDPVAVDAAAKRDQAALIERHGGRDAVVNKGTFGPTPAPGEKAKFEARTN